MRLAERRVRASSETEMGSFASCLEDNLDGGGYEATFRQAASEVAARVRERVRGGNSVRRMGGRAGAAQGFAAGAGDRVAVTRNPDRT